MAKKIVVNEEIQDFFDDWSWTGQDGKLYGYDKKRVEDAIKAQFGTKVGDIRLARNEEDSKYYDILVFDTVAHAEAWDEAPDSVTPIARRMLPISTVQADSYRAVLSTSKTGSSNTSPFLMKRGTGWVVPLRLNVWHIIAAMGGEQEPMAGTGTLTVERSVNGTNWDATKLTATISAADTDDPDTFPSSIDIGEFVNTGQDTQLQVRLTASFPYTDADNNDAVMTSQPIIIHIKTVTLAVSMADSEWQLPKVVQSGSLSIPSLTFTLQGSVNKSLHVAITNTSFVQTYTHEFGNITAIGEYQVSPYDSSGTMGITNSGVHEIEAWLSCSDGDGGTLYSEHIKHQIMVVNTGQQEASLVRRVLIQGMSSVVDNFVQSTVCNYMVWNPKLVDGSVQNDTSENVQVQFIVADELDLSEEHEIYLSLPVTATPGEKIPLVGTIEVESENISKNYPAYLHAVDQQGNSLLQKVLYFTIDNSAGFQPIGGAVFKLNPKTRNNGEQDAQTIINTRNGQVVESIWDGFKMDDSDGYTTDEYGNKALLVPAGRKLTIRYNPFAYLFNAPQASKALAIDIPFRVRNVTNEKDPVFRIAEYQDEIDAWLGLMMRPMDGTMVSVLSGGATGETDFRWAEDRIQHLCVTVTPNVYPNEFGDILYNSRDEENAHGSIDLVRVYINGVIIRELKYTPGNATEFCTGAMSNGGIIIGQTGTEGRNSGADIYIYGMTVWESVLRPRQVLQNHISALSSSEDKRREKAKNDILKDDNSGRLSLGKCHEAGLNTWVWHGDMPLIDSDKKKGWAEVKRFDHDGNYLPQYSGTFCKATKNLQANGQGTTAMTYYYWNMQIKLGDVTDTIELTPEQIHSTIVLGTPVESEGNWTVPIYGGCLGKDYPVGNGTKSYPCTVDGEGNLLTVTLPDGWIDGNGLYRGQCWQNGPNRPLSQKLVLKINYASSMQSHLIGVNWLYNALHTAYCGENSLQAGTPTEYKAQVAKQVEPVLFFTADKSVEDEQTTLGTAVYQGPGGFGPGKMDKPTWGYSSKYSGHNHFGMFEGAANNTVLSDFLAPWDDQDHVLSDNSIQPAKVKYFLHDPANASAKDPESFFYRHTVLNEGVEQDQWEKGVGFDAGKTGQSGATAEMPATASDSPDDAPAPHIMKIIRDAWNYVYQHNPNINLYKGSFTAFQQLTFSEWQQKQKWVCIANGEDPDNYMLKRWDFCERRWVDAGLWNSTNHAYDQIDIRYFEGMNWANMTAEEKADRDGVVAKFKGLLIAEAYPSENNEGIGAYFKTTSLRFHYAFINTFIAGTDNCSKNTYYMIDPQTHLIELNQDDVDTVMPTDNFGYQTKPYYIDRTHPYPEGSNVSGYDGMQNGLFDLVEALWLNDSNHTIAQTLGQVLTLMAALTGGIGSSESDGMNGVWRALNRYLFDIQRYIPKVAYNEAARIRYEFPAMVGYTGRDGQARPLAQSMGDQLEAEIQFMKRRLVYMASYASFGEFSPNIGAGRPSTGIADLSTTFSVPVETLPNGANPTYKFKLKPHQYLYPCLYKESSTYHPYHRTAPDEEFEYSVSGLNANGYALVLPGINYYQSIGNVGDLSATGENFRLELQGTRMTEFVAEPTYYYPTAGGERITAEAWAALTNEQKANYLPAYRPKSVSVSESYGATRLRKLSLKGCTTISHSAALPMDLRRLVVAEEIDLRSTNVAAVRLPQTSTLETLRLPAGITSLRLENMPSLATVSLEGYAALQSLYIDEKSNAESFNLVSSIYDTVGNSLSELSVYGVDWSGIRAAILTWITSIGSYDITGKVALQQEENLPFSTVLTLIEKYHDIQDEDNVLYVDYTKRGITSIDITGVKYIKQTGEWNGWGINVNPPRGNNVAIVNGRPAISFELTGTNLSHFAEVTDAVTGKVNVLNVEITEHPTQFTLTVTITKTDGTTVSRSKTVGFANRIPQVGDFAYHDGTFDNEYDTSKTIVGAVVKRDIILTGDDEVDYVTVGQERIANNYKCWVHAKENANVDTLITNGQMAWGIYQNADYIPEAMVTEIRDKIQEHSGVRPSITDLAGLTNFSSVGAGSNPTSYSSNIAHSSFLDDSKDDGYAVVSSGAASDFRTEENNDTIMQIIDYIVEDYFITHLDIISDAPTTPAELADAMRAIQNYRTAQGDSSVTRFRALLFPATYACRVYEPTMPEGVELHSQYKRGNWMLPACGLQTRIINFYFNSRGRDNNNTASYSYANYNPDNEAKMPLYANLHKRIREATGLNMNTNELNNYFAMPTASYYWTSSEYGSASAWLVFSTGTVYGTGHKGSTGHTARGVVAFTFNL